MNNELTIILVSFFSKNRIKKILNKINSNNKIVIVENSLSVTLPAGIQVKAVSVIGGPQKVKFTQTGGQLVLFTADKSIVKQTEALVFKLVTS